MFIKSKEAKERLRPALAAGNIEKTMSAPVTVIVAHDMKFYDHLEKISPGKADSWASATPEIMFETTLRNGALQAAYLIFALRSLGLDTGPMTGFDRATVDAVFFAEMNWRSDMLINIGYGDRSSLRERMPRLEFAESCQIL